MGNSCAKRPKPKGKNYKLKKSEEMGLGNLGNSCYINSVLHSLKSLSKLDADISQSNPNKKVIISLSIQKIFKALEENNEVGYEKYINQIKKVPEFTN